jgi:porin
MKVLVGSLIGGLMCMGLAAIARAEEPASADGVAEPRLFTPSLIYDGTAFGNLSGGARRGATYSGDLNLRLYIDPAPWSGIPGLFAYVDALWIHGGQPSRWVGDAQGVSNISAAPSLEPFEAWVQKNTVGDGFSVLAGLYDVNSEFYRLQTAGLFLNSSFGIGPEFGQTGIEGPSIFPRTAWGLRATVQPGDYLSLQTAVVNGVPFERPDGSHALHKAGDGALVMTEIAIVDRFRLGAQRRSQRSRLGRNAAQPAHDSKLAIGLWHYTAEFADQSDRLADGSPRLRHGSSGYYVIGESLLYARAGSSGPRLSGFLQAGLGDAKVNRFGSYAGGGLTATGLLRAAGDDELGVAVNVARNGSHYRAAQARAGQAAARAESALEISYLLPVNKRLAVQPDLQFIHRPDTDPARKDAVAFQLRFELTY